MARFYINDGPNPGARIPLADVRKWTRTRGSDVLNEAQARARGRIPSVLPPSMTSPSSFNVNSGEAVSLQITASNSPTSYGAIGLPTGLSINPTTGLITGITTVLGTTTVTIVITGPGGVTTTSVSVVVATAAPAARQILISGFGDYDADQDLWHYSSAFNGTYVENRKASYGADAWSGAPLGLVEGGVSGLFLHTGDASRCIVFDESWGGWVLIDRDEYDQNNARPRAYNYATQPADFPAPLVYAGPGLGPWFTDYFLNGTSHDISAVEVV
jgi:hypothetical protein